MVTYKLPPVDEKGNLPQCITKIDGDILTGIPFAEGNSDYAEYLRWLEAGNQPLPADEVTGG